jgi:hypothetical protein
LTGGKATNFIAQKNKDASAAGFALAQDDWKSHIKIAIFIKIGSAPIFSPMAPDPSSLLRPALKLALPLPR